MYTPRKQAYEESLEAKKGELQTALNVAENKLTTLTERLQRVIKELAHKEHELQLAKKELEYREHELQLAHKRHELQLEELQLIRKKLEELQKK